MEIRMGSYLRSTANIVAQFPLPFGFQFVVFSQREGGTIGYIFGAGQAPESVKNAAAAIAETLD